MNNKPLFVSVEQAVTVLWPVTIRLSGLLMWTAIALLHTALLTLALLALWWTQTTPAQVGSAFQQSLQTWPVAALAAAGVSAGTVLAGYWWVLKRLHRALGRPLATHLLRGSGPD